MDFEEFDFEGEMNTSNEDYEDRDTLRRSKQALGLTRSYVPSWTSRDALREFYQNWIDGIMEAHRISRDNVRITIKESKDKWLAVASRSESTEMIGFIKFLESKGILEITNFKAQLSRKALNLNISSKRNQEGAAGTHGEGFKVASLVMVRKEYQVRYESTNYYWNFQFGGRDKRHLYCHLTPMKDTEVAKRMRVESSRIASKKSRDAKANIWEDVSVKIGRVHGSKAKAIDFTTFRSWIKVSLALDPPCKIFKTPRANLIMDKSFGGRLYLKGLYIEGTSHSKQIKFAYDLNEGKVNRDRERLIDEEEEASLIAHVWAEAISAGYQDSVKEYTKILLEDDTRQWADVNLAEKNITKTTAIAIWKHLKELDPKSEVFYHYQKTADQDTEVIRHYFKKIPSPIPTCIWAPLSKFGLGRTPEKQRYHLLHNAPPSSIANTAFSLAFVRALHAALGLDERTKALNLVFKSGHMLS